MEKINPDWWKTVFDEIYLITDARSACDDNRRRRFLNVIGFNNISKKSHQVTILHRKRGG